MIVFRKRTKSSRDAEMRIDINITLFRICLFSLYYDQGIAGFMLFGIGIEWGW